MLNFQSMITILKDKGEMETRGSPLPGYVKLKLQIYYQTISNNGDAEVAATDKSQFYN